MNAIQFFLDENEEKETPEVFEKIQGYLAALQGGEAIEIKNMNVLITDVKISRLYLGVIKYKVVGHIL